MTSPQATLTAAQRLRQQLSGGKVLTQGAPGESHASASPAAFDDDFLNSELVGVSGNATDAQAADQASAPNAHVRATPPPVSPAPPRPGVFTRPVPPMAQPEQTPSSGSSKSNEPAGPATAAKALSAVERLRAQVSVDDNTREIKRELASMKTLTRMLEAICARPGSTATVKERMDSLSQLAINTRQLADCVAKSAGDNTERNGYICAMAMDAAVALTCRSWEAGRDMDWPTLIEASVNTTEIMGAADDIAYAQTRKYEPVSSAVQAADRLSVSMHSAFWQLIELGEAIEGLTPKVAAQIVRDCANYLQSRDKFVADPTMQVAWLQGSIRRMTNLVCAELRARFADTGLVPTNEEIEAVLAVSRSGFEGVENYAQSILEKSRPEHVPRPGA